MSTPSDTTPPYSARHAARLASFDSVPETCPAIRSLVGTAVATHATTALDPAQQARLVEQVMEIVQNVGTEPLREALIKSGESGAAWHSVYREEHSRRLRLQDALLERDALIETLQNTLNNLVSTYALPGTGTFGPDEPLWEAARQALAVMHTTSNRAQIAELFLQEVPSIAADLAELGKPTDEPNAANGSVYARLNWWRDHCSEMGEEMAELRKDRERLDWLEAPGSWYRTEDELDLSQTETTWRAAIDAARAKDTSAHE